MSSCYQQDDLAFRYYSIATFVNLILVFIQRHFLEFLVICQSRKIIYEDVSFFWYSNDFIFSVFTFCAIRAALEVYFYFGINYRHYNLQHYFYQLHPPTLLPYIRTLDPRDGIRLQVGQYFLLVSIFIRVLKYLALSNRELAKMMLRLLWGGRDAGNCVCMCNAMLEFLKSPTEKFSSYLLKVWYSDTKYIHILRIPDSSIIAYTPRISNSKIDTLKKQVWFSKYGDLGFLAYHLINGPSVTISE